MRRPPRFFRLMRRPADSHGETIEETPAAVVAKLGPTGKVVVLTVFVL